MFYVEHFSFSTVVNKPDGGFPGRDKKNRRAGMAPEKKRITPSGAENVRFRRKGRHGVPQRV